MSDIVDFLAVIVDQVRASLVGLSLLPVLVISLLIGIIQSKKTAYALKALLATGLSLGVAALWPLKDGLTPVWPDVMAIETHIRLLVTFVLAFLIIRFLCVIKNTISLTPKKV
ncbi:hypothetical protein [Asticcacaulis tiandongensis]|uniref:hypothetical protein n=1 Tax=Asticcacaulis tiandongensis TaxID=2565365 RepID=UPI00112B0FAC|nr:hypothetical protein [Asticcacaulis tiandongensis]